MSNRNVERHGSSSRSWSSWMNAEQTVFSRSLRSGEDEEALKWAALEKLPTFNRIRRGLTTAAGELREIDIHKLGPEEKKSLLERLIKTGDNNMTFLSKLRDRMDRVGIVNPTTEVRFQHLNIKAEVFVSASALPTIPNSILNIFEGILTHLGIFRNRKKTVYILHDVSGIIKPSRMTLLLGHPGAGKSTLLRALAGKVDKNLKVSGRITYNGHDMDEFVPQRSSAYIDQHDVHIPEMTVRETLTFAARCQGVGYRYEMLKELVRREKIAKIKPDPDLDVFMKAASLHGQEENVMTEYVLRILGLESCANTLVGDAMLKGISGGEKRRVTTGEMLVGPAMALFMDEISTGLDNYSSYKIVDCLRQSIHILGGSALISLLQPAPETYELFDDIMLLSDGYIVYQGPREFVIEFFETMGFKCPERKGNAEFLLEVTSRKDQQQYWARKDELYRYVPSEEFANALEYFHVGRSLRNELDTPFDKSKSHPCSLSTSKYGASKEELFRACFSRERLLMKRNSATYIIRIAQVVVIAFITMTVFLRTKMHHHSIDDGSVFMGSLFMSVIFVIANGFSELPMVLLKLPVFYRQRNHLFFPSLAYALPAWFLKIPISMIETAVWVALTYYVIGYDPNISRMFKQYLVLLLFNQTTFGLFRATAACSRTMTVALACGNVVLIAMVTFGGFVESRYDIKKWWKWCYWSSPLMYSFTALSTNEFHAGKWASVNSDAREALGMQVLNSHEVFTSSHWYWIGVAALVGYIFLYNLVFTLALAVLDPYKIGHATPSEEISSNPCTSDTEQGNHVITIAKPRDNITCAVAAGGRGRKGIVLPFAPMTVTFDDIRYSIDMPRDIKAHGILEDRIELLKGVSGCFRPGILTALMGTSGAGKTTLMDVLSGRKTVGHIEGNIRISGHPKKQETFARVTGYCEQNDIHSPHVTVHESLLYSSWLRLPSDVVITARKNFVEEVMELVELSTLRDAIVGLPGVNGLSTEERKRLTIAVELVANPSILFMDEPTSGLDARATASLMRTVRNTVDTGRTVVCTIHQPGIDVFEAFDELLLLKRGGEEIYAGPLGPDSCHLISYFESIKGVPKIRDGYNPANWMLEVTTDAQEALLEVNFADIYKCSELYRRNKALIMELSTPPTNSRELYFTSKYSQPFLVQCMACLWKQHLSYWRNPTYTALRFLFTIVIAVMVGTAFWKHGKTTRKSQDLLNSLGSMYIAVAGLGFQNTVSVQPVVMVERTVFYREIASGMYSALAYALAQVTIEIPYVMFQTLVYVVFVYATVSFHWSAAKFFWYLFYMFLTLLYFTYYGMMMVAVTPNPNITTIASVAFYILWNLFSGFIVPRPRIPLWWRWYYWACPVAWTLYGLTASQFGDIEDTMDNGQTVKDFLREYFGFKHDFIGVVAVTMVAISMFFASIFGISIMALNFQKR